MEFWTNTVTLYSLCGGSYVRTGVFENCFWKREDSLIYEDGRRRKLRKFLVRIPAVCLIEPGDIIALGRHGEEADDDFISRHTGDAFRVDKVLISGNRPVVSRCGGVNIA